jgi:hypothetical protein
MSLFEKVLIGGGLAWLARTMHRNALEEQRRRDSPLTFEDGLTREDFEALATATARQTPRVVRSEVVGMTVHLHIQSISGLSEWQARVDFNDYGHLTGRRWIESENDDSQVPSYFADTMSAEIRTRAPRRERVEYPRPGAAQANPSPSPNPRSAPAGWYPTAAGPRFWNGVAWEPNHPSANVGHQHEYGMSRPTARTSGTAAVVFAWLITAGTFGYMLPWAVAVTRGAPNRNAVGLLCLFTGWTFIGWVVALVMACTS